MTRLGIVTGLASEADCLRRQVSSDDVVVLCAGANSGRAAQAGRRLLEQGCTGLLSFGMAGGLGRDLAPGALIVPHRVLDADGDMVAVDESWRARLIDALSPMAIGEGDIAGSTELVASRGDKLRLHQRTKAAAVDMESLAVARVARQARVPFLALRVIADPAGRAPPPWVMETIDATGHVRPAVAVRALIRRPFDLPTVIRLARDSRVALTALRRVAMSAGTLFSF